MDCKTMKISATVPQQLEREIVFCYDPALITRNEIFSMTQMDNDISRPQVSDILEGHWNTMGRVEIL
jgi:hypothetical protein